MANSPFTNILRRFVEDQVADFNYEFGGIQRLQVQPERAVEKADWLSGKILDDLKEELSNGRSPILENLDTEDSGWLIGLTGRMNLIHGREDFCFYAVLVSKLEVRWAGILDFPKATLCWAIPNEGAHTRSKCRVSSRKELADGMMLFPWKREDSATFAPVAESTDMHTRKNGCPLSDVLETASGYADVLTSTRLTQAEALIINTFITEAGGFASDLKGQPVTYKTTELVAANSKLHGKMLRAMK